VSSNIHSEWSLVTHLKVKVHNLVGEAGEFIAEAEIVGARFEGVEINRVVLLSLAFI
jgi:hypothetical protein